MKKINKEKKVYLKHNRQKKDQSKNNEKLNVSNILNLHSIPDQSLPFQQYLDQL